MYPMTDAKAALVSVAQCSAWTTAICGMVKAAGVSPVASQQGCVLVLHLSSIYCGINLDANACSPPLYNKVFTACSIPITSTRFQTLL